MTSIDDLLGGANDKQRVVERARDSQRAILFALPSTEDGPGGEWAATWHGITRGDLAHAIAILQAELTRDYLEDIDDDE